MRPSVMVSGRRRRFQHTISHIPLAAGVLAFAGLTLSPAVGAILTSASTIVVALNAQLLRRVRLSA